jgi:hypothetical protein
MTQPINLRAEYWAVGYTNYDKDFKIVGKYLNYKTRFGRGYSYILPPGSWQIICTTKEVTVKQAATIVQMFNNGVYRDYALAEFDPCDEYMSCFLDPIESLESLLKSKGCDGPNYIILKKS